MTATLEFEEDHRIVVTITSTTIHYVFRYVSRPSEMSFVCK